MHTTVIIDIVVALILLAFIIQGGQRGLFRSLAGLLAVAVALVGAGYAANYFTPKAEKYLEPYIEKRIQSRENTAFSQNKNQKNEKQASQSISTENLVKLFGLDSEVSDSIAQSAKEKIQDAGTAVTTAVEESMAQSVVHVLLVVLAFLILLALLRILIHAVDLVLKLPGLHFLNHLGGAILGLVEGALFLFLAVWVLRRFGVSFDTQTVEETTLLRFFTINTPLSVLSFL